MNGNPYIFSLIILIITTSNCSCQVDSPFVKIRTEVYHSYKQKKNNEISKWRKRKEKVRYIKYDKKGNEIEVGEYGETFSLAWKIKTKDKSTSSVRGHGTDMKKLNYITYNSYNEDNQLVKVECGKFKRNKREYLISKKKYLYINGELAEEIKYNSNNEITKRTKLKDKVLTQESTVRKTHQDSITTIGNTKIVSTFDSEGKETDKKEYLDNKLVNAYRYFVDSEIGIKEKTSFTYNKYGHIDKIYYSTLWSKYEELKTMVEYKYRYYK